MMSRFAKDVCAFVALAAGFSGALTVPSQAQSQMQQNQPKASATQSAQASKRACQFTDRVGTKSCADKVTEPVCAAIAREAGGTYAWTATDCP